MKPTNKLFNYSDFKYFAIINPIPGSWGFTSYSDGVNTYEAIRGLNPQTKNPIPFDIYFSTRERVYKCGNRQKVKVIVNGNLDKLEDMLLYDYIRKHPSCENSANSNSDSPSSIFKELDEQKDARMHTDRIKRRNDAVNKALAMKPEDYDEVAPLIGVFTDDLDVKQRAILLFAEQDPETFFSYVEKKDETPVRALIRKALQMRVLTNLGEAIFWDKEALGGTEDQAVAYLIGNKDKLSALKQLVKKTK